MQRRKFITATAASLPAFTFAKNLPAAMERNPKGFVVKAKKGRFNETTVLFGGTSPNDIKVSEKDTDSSLTVFEYTGNVKGGPPLHINDKQDEIFYIVDGAYSFKVGEDIHHLTAGDTIFLPRKVAHAFAQTSEKGKLLFMFQPSGQMEDFFRKSATVKGQPTPEEGAKLFADHGMKVVGPPLQI